MANIKLRFDCSKLKSKYVSFFKGARKKVSKLSKTFLKKKMNLEKSDLPLSRLMVKPLTHLLKGITTKGYFYLVTKPQK